MRKSEIEYRIWKYIHCHPSEIHSIIKDESIDFQVILSEMLLLANMFLIIDDTLINRINLIYPLIVDSTTLHDKIEEQFVKLIREFKQKFEMKCGI